MRFGLLGAILAAALAPTACGDERSSGDDDEGGGVGGGGAAAPAHALVDGVQLVAIDVNQGVRRLLMENGTPAVSNVPLLAGRGARMRLYYAVDPALYNGGAVIARVTVGDAPPIETAATLAGISTVENIASTINLDVPGELFTPGASYRVELLQAATVASGTNTQAGFPLAAQDPLPVVSAPALKLVIVPIQYQADGSGRLPDTSEAQLQLVRDGFFSHYPLAEIAMTVASPLPLSTAVQANGAGWDVMLNAVADLRAQSGAAFDEYYYAMVAPAPSFASFCAGGCVSGLSLLAAAPTDDFLRAGTGIGFTGTQSVGSAIHEVGHMHGRQHAPCGTGQGVDPSYPYAGGAVGTWGFDLVGGTVIDPTVADFMGYCDPTWVSDYTYTALFTRATALGAAYGSAEPRAYDRAMIGADGELTWIDPIEAAPLGAPSPIEARIDGRAVTLSGHFYRYSHLPGGVLLVP